MNLNTIENINSALSAVRNNKDIRPEVFYNKILLDTIKVPVENYVHLKYATKSLTLPKGHQKMNLRRMGSLTAHTEVLREGIPPRPDQTQSESIELSATQFGRFMFFTDQIRTDIIDDVVAHYTKELSDLAVRTLEKFAREKLLSSTSVLFPNNKTSVGDLVPGDIITLADLRLQVEKLKRLLVAPIDGLYHYIHSPEFTYDLLDDPYVQKYLEWGSNVKYFETGEVPALFKLKFIETILDENIAPDLDHPGEYMSGGKHFLRLCGKNASGVDVIFSVEAEATGTHKNEADCSITAAQAAGRFVLTNYYYRDGSAIENRVYWKVATAVPSATTGITKVYKFDADTGKYVTGAVADVTVDVLTSARELPVNRGILTGKDGLVKVMVEGQGGTEIIVKPLGSAGTADPLNQLSSIGFKIRGVGFGFERPEAVVVTYSVPNKAAEIVGLTTVAMELNNPVPEKGHIVNVNGVDQYAGTTHAPGVKVVAGQKVISGDDQYVALINFTLGTTAAADVAAGKLVKLGTKLVANPTDLGL